MSKAKLKSKFPRKFPCPICEELISVGITKKKKPYLICNSCGMQLFIRGKKGIKLFSDLNKKKIEIKEINPLETEKGGIL